MFYNLSFLSMKNMGFRLVLGLALMFFLQKMGAQSGWARAKNDVYLQVGAGFLSSENYKNLAGERLKTTRFSQQNFVFYGEYGLTNRLTAIAQSAPLRINRYETTEAVAAPSDLRVELKYAILRKKWPVSIAIGPEIPLGRRDNFARHKKPNDLGIFETANLATTDGETNIWTTLAASSSWGKYKGWATVFSAYNLRTRGFTDQFHGGFEVGYKITAPFYVKTRGAVLVSVSDEPNQNVPFFRGEGTEMSAVSAGFGWRFSRHFGVTADYWRCVSFPVKVRNAYVGPVIAVGIFYKK